MRQFYTGLLNILNRDYKKIYRVGLMVLALGVVSGKGWGQYTYTFTSSQFTASPQTKTLSSVDWTLTNNGNFYGIDATKGQQVGSAGNPATSMTLSTTGISGTIQSVKIYTSGASSVVATVAVSVGGSNYGSAASISATNTQYIFNGSSSGQIVISWSQSSSKALYIKQIDITYAACTAPTMQASALSSNNRTTDGFNLALSPGNGTGTVLVVRPTSASSAAPVSGTTYTSNLTWASAGQIDANNRVVYMGSGPTAGPVTGLSPETQYTVTAYEYSGAYCYNTTSPPASTQYTYSLEPASHAAAFTATPVSSTQVNLAFSAAGSIANADGYIILYRNDGVTPNTSGVVDGTASGSWSLPSGTSILTNISNAATTLFNNGSLSASTNYCYLLIPYNWDGSNNATYNYLTSAGTPSACATTNAPPAPTINSSLTQSSVYGTAATYTITATNSPTSFNATGLPAGLSVNTTSGVISGTPTVDVGTYNINISATNGSGTDNKSLVWTITARPLTITGVSASNKTYDGNTTATIGGTPMLNTIVFSDNVTVSGTGSGVFTNKNVGSGKTITVSGYSLSGTKAGNYSLSQPSGITANITAKTLTVTGATAQNKSYDGTTTATITTAVLVGVVSPDVVTVSGGGTFASANVGTGISVTASLTLGGADAGNYTLTQPAGLTANITAVAPTFTTSAIGVTVGGTFSLPGSNISSTSSGTITYTLGTPSPAGSITLTGGNVLNGLAAGTATLTVNQAANGNYTAGSTTVAVTASSYSNGDYRSTGDGSWHSTVGSSTSTWQRYSGGTWTNSAAPSTATSSNVYIFNNVYLVGTNTAASVIVGSGGLLSTSTVNATFGKLLVQSGGVFNKQGYVKINTSIEVEDNATFNFATGNTTSRSSTIWNGTEIFHPNSNFVIQASDNTSNFLIIEDNNDISLFSNGVNSACFGNVIIDLSVGKLQLLPTGFTKPLALGNLIFRNLNGNNLRISDGNYSTTIFGNIEIESTVTNSITMLTTAGTTSITVKGNFNHNGTAAFRLANNTTSTIISALTVEGDINLSGNGGNIDFNGNTNSGDQTTSTIVLKGDLSAASTSFLTTTNAIHPGTLNFSGTGDGLTPATTQTVSIASTATTRNQNITTYVKSGAYVQLANSNWELGKNSTVNVENGGVLDFGFSGSTALNITSVSGATGTGFTSAAGSTLKITSPDGINSSTGSVGNVQVTASNRTFTQPATYWYLGKSNQMTGDAILANSAKLIYVNLASNALTLTPSGNIGINNTTTLDPLGGKLEIQKGIVIGSGSGDFTGSGRLVMSDGEYRISTITSNPSTDFLPQLSGYSNYSLPGGTVHLNGNNAIQVLSGIPSYNNLAFSGTNQYGVDYKSVSSGTTVNNNIAILSSSIVDLQTKTLGGTTTSLSMSGSSRYITGGSGLKPDAGGIYTLGTGTTIEFSNSAGSTIRLSPQYANVEISGTNVTNSTTTGSLQLQPSSTFKVKSTGVYKVSNVNGFTGALNTAVSNNNTPTITLDSGSTIEYNSTSAQAVTGRNDYSNLTVSNGNIKTMNGDVNVGNVLNLSLGILTSIGYNLVVTNTATTAITGGSATSFINGPLTRTLPPGLSSNSLVYKFPVGKSSVYLPFTLTNPKTSSAPSITVEAFNSNSTGVPDNTTITSISQTEYWKASATAGLTGASIGLSRPADVSPFNVIAEAATVGGTYTSINGVPNGTYTIDNSADRSLSPQYFVLASGLPVITSFTSNNPATTQSGYTGSILTINGINLQNATVKLNNVAASILSNNGTVINAEVMDGATGPLVVTTLAGPKTGGTFTYLGYITTGSGNWSAGSNWLGGAAPGSGSDITINDVTTLDIDVATNNLTLNAGKTLAIGDHTLTLNKSFSDNTSHGLIGSKSSNLTMGSGYSSGLLTLNQSTPFGNYLNKLTLNASATLGDSLNIAPCRYDDFANTGTVTINNGVLNTGGNLVLMSDATGTARIAKNTSGTPYVNGDVTVQRFLPQKRAWRLVTAPITGNVTINKAWQEGLVYNSENTTSYTAGTSNIVPPANIQGWYGIHITGGSVLYPTGSAANAAGFDYGVTSGSPSIRIFDPVALNWTKTVPAGPLTTNIKDYPAYMLFSRGDRTIDPKNTSAANATDANIRATSSIGQNDKTINFANASLVLIGNPYPSPIDFERIITNPANSANFQPQFYAWDASLNTFGGYRLVVKNGINSYYSIPYNKNGTPLPQETTGDYQHIQSGQGFFVMPSNGTVNSIAIRETDKSENTHTNIFNSVNRPAISANLGLGSGNDVRLADGVMALFGEEFLEGIDKNDVLKPDNFNETLAINSHKARLMLEARPPVTANDTIFLSLNGVTNRPYQLSFLGEHMPANVAARLVDTYLNTSTALALDGSETMVDFAVTTNAGSKKADRFMIVFNYTGVLPVNFTSIKAYEKNKDVQVEWNMANEEGTVRYEVERSADGIIFTKAGSKPVNSGGTNAGYNWLDASPFTGANYYRIKAVNVAGGFVYSQTVKVNIGKSTGDISIYPNPIAASNFAIQFTNEPAGKYNIQLINSLGQQVYSGSFVHAGGSASVNIQLHSTLPSGIYQLHISGGQTNVTRQVKAD